MMWSQLAEWLKANGATSGFIAALVAFIIFILTRIFEIQSRIRTTNRARKRIVIGLFREVQANLKSIEKFLDKEPYPGDLREKVSADKEFRPVFIMEESVQFYDSIASSLPEIHSDALVALSRFYERIRTEREVIRVFESLAFPTISPEGRASTVDDLWRALRHAERDGLRALYELELAYPRRWFSDFRSE